MDELSFDNQVVPPGQSSTPVLGQPAERLVVPVLEEQVVVGGEVVETGRVRLTRHVAETTEEVSVPLQHDEVRVEHVPLNLTLPAGATPPATRYEGDTLIIPVLREVVVVETRLLLVEEVRVTRQQLTTQHVESVPLRREEIRVEHLPAAPPPENPSA